MEQQTDSDSLPPERERPRLVISRLSALVLGFLVAMIGAGTLVLAVAVSHSQAANDARDKAFIGCIATYSDHLADALNARYDASAAATLQLDLVFDRLVEMFDNLNPETQKKLVEAARDYKAQRNTAKQELTQHPFPEAPRNACAELRDH